MFYHISRNNTFGNSVEIAQKLSKFKCHSITDSRPKRKFEIDCNKNNLLKCRSYHSLEIKKNYSRNFNIKDDLKKEKQTITISTKLEEIKINTHKYLAMAAVNVLIKDIHSVMFKEMKNNFDKFKAVSFFEDSVADIYRGCVYPDIYENDVYLGIPTFKGHFFDPDTFKNYMGNLVPSAYTRFIEHALEAKRKFEKGEKKFAIELGKALHYLSDAGEPHHCSNQIAYITTHLDFERYAKAIKHNVAINTSNYYYTFSLPKLEDEDNFEKYCKNLLVHTAKVSKKHSEKLRKMNFSCAFLQNPKNPKKVDVKLRYIDYKNLKILNNITRRSLLHSQDVMAGFLFNFLKAIRVISD